MHPVRSVWWPAELLDPFDLPRGRNLPEGCLQGILGILVHSCAFLCILYAAYICTTRFCFTMDLLSPCHTSTNIHTQCTIHLHNRIVTDTLFILISILTRIPPPSELSYEQILAWTPRSGEGPPEGPPVPPPEVPHEGPPATGSPPLPRGAATPSPDKEVSRGAAAGAAADDSPFEAAKADQPGQPQETNAPLTEGPTQGCPTEGPTQGCPTEAMEQGKGQLTEAVAMHVGGQLRTHASQEDGIGADAAQEVAVGSVTQHLPANQEAAVDGAITDQAVSQESLPAAAQPPPSASEPLSLHRKVGVVFDAFVVFDVGNVFDGRNVHPLLHGPLLSLLHQNNHLFQVLAVFYGDRHFRWLSPSAVREFARFREELRVESQQKLQRRKAGGLSLFYKGVQVCVCHCVSLCVRLLEVALDAPLDVPLDTGHTTHNTLGTPTTHTGFRRQRRLP